MIRVVSISIILFTVLLTASLVSAQIEVDTVGNLSGVEIVTAIDRTESYVGDMINYSVTIIYDTSYQLTPPPLGANLGAFEVKDYKPDVETELDGGRIQSRTEFVLSTYTTGDYIIPPMPVLFTLPDSSRKIMVSEALPITILSLLGDESDSLSLKGPGAMGSLKANKAPFEFKRDYTWHYIYGSLALLVLLGLAYYWYWRKHRRVDSVEIDLREPWEIAFEKMAHLKEKRYLEDGSFKMYYIDLTELIREFLGRVYVQDTLEMTTGELAVTFRDLVKPENLFDQMLEFMHHADLVKFAKYDPETERAESDYLFIHELISDIRNESIRKAEAERLAQATKQASKTRVPEGQNV